MAQGADFGELIRAKHKDQYSADVKTLGPDDLLPLIQMRNNRGRYLAPHAYRLTAPTATCPLTTGIQPHVMIRDADWKNPPIPAHYALYTVSWCLRTQL